MPKLLIDGHEITVDQGTTILQAAERLGIYIPHYCYHPGLSLAGSCRMCLVEEERSVKLIPACCYEVTEGMNVKTDTEKVIQARKAVMEFLLINHPLDCPVCDKAGECQLQDYAHEYGQQKSRMTVPKNRFPKKDLGRYVLIWPERCILCSRCVRFCQEISGTSELFVLARGDHSEISVMPGKRLDNRLSGNVVELCPVGALISKHFLYKSRVWYLNKSAGICPLCSRGCNVYYEHRDRRVFRVLARPNTRVNDYWLCDTGRYEQTVPAAEDRVAAPMIRRDGGLQQDDLEPVITAVKMKLKEMLSGDAPGLVAGIGSPCCTNEDNYMLRRFLSMIGSVNLALFPAVDKQDGESFPGGFTISGVKAPNQNGAADMLGVTADRAGYDALLDQIDGGEIKALFILRDYLDAPLEERVLALLKKVPCLVVLDALRSSLTEMAHFVLPAALFFEKEGTLTNDRRQVQHTPRVLMPRSLDVLSPWAHFAKLIRAFDEKTVFHAAGDVFEEIAKDIKGYRGINYSSLKDREHALETQ
jgi:NADH-quinone oxidoreductase subunit G